MKYRVFFLLVAILIAFTSCKTGIPNEEISSKTLSDTTESTSLDTPPENNLNEKQIMLEVMDVDSTEFDEIEFTDENASSTVTVEILGKSYTMDYKKSIAFELINLKAHMYESDDGVRAFFDPENKKIIKYENVPYFGVCNTEDEYKNFVVGIIDSDIDLSQYNYSCRTQYRVEESLEYGTSYNVRVTNRFYIPDVENEFVESYYFDFTKEVRNIPTMDHICVRISKQTNAISLEMYALGYVEDDFCEILTHIDEMTESAKLRAEEYLIERYFYDHKILSVDIINNYLFIENGKSYLISYIVAKFSPNEYPEYESNYGVAIVTWLK